MEVGGWGGWESTFERFKTSEYQFSRLFNVQLLKQVEKNSKDVKWDFQKFLPTGLQM